MGLYEQLTGFFVLFHILKQFQDRTRYGINVIFGHCANFAKVAHRNEFTHTNKDKVSPDLSKTFWTPCV